ncbi:hypothetical protein EDB85DRAFT_1898934 [Lactarius pseudohatsudake]|nr:hypothetical protein EDB85DRAFT_1898934 [Lactarius pseudohatsudake]
MNWFEVRPYRGHSFSSSHLVSPPRTASLSPRSRLAHSRVPVRSRPSLFAFALALAVANLPDSAHLSVTPAGSPPPTNSHGLGSVQRESSTPFVTYTNRMTDPKPYTAALYTAPYRVDSLTNSYGYGYGFSVTVLYPVSIIICMMHLDDFGWLNDSGRKGARAVQYQHQVGSVMDLLIAARATHTYQQSLWCQVVHLASILAYLATLSIWSHQASLRLPYQRMVVSIRAFCVVYDCAITAIESHKEMESEKRKLRETSAIFSTGPYWPQRLVGHYGQAPGFPAQNIMEAVNVADVSALSL